VRCFRDPTRGGLASTLNELASQSQVDMVIDEDAVPVKDTVRGACEMLGYDVMQVANEGKMVCVVPADQADAALAAIKADPHGADAAIIGDVAEMQPDRGSKVFLKNAFGGRRILDMLVGEQLPRIC
jgi:hydrogenase expression/formation protein HypE